MSEKPQRVNDGDDEFCEYNDCTERPSRSCRKCDRKFCQRHYHATLQLCTECYEDLYDSGMGGDAA